MPEVSSYAKSEATSVASPSSEELIKARKELFKKYPPKCVYVSSSRILCAKNAKFDEMRAGGGSAVAYAWYEFEKGYSGKSELKWIN